MTKNCMSATSSAKEDDNDVVDVIVQVGSRQNYDEEFVLFQVRYFKYVYRRERRHVITWGQTRFMTSMTTKSRHIILWPLNQLCNVVVL